MMKFIHTSLILLLILNVDLTAQEDRYIGESYWWWDPWSHPLCKHRLPAQPCWNDKRNWRIILFVYNQSIRYIAVSSVGYELVRLPVVIGATQVFNVRLVTKASPSKLLWLPPGEKSAFKNPEGHQWTQKANNPSRLSGYQYKAYTKLRLDLEQYRREFKDQAYPQRFRLCIQLYGFIGNI